MADFKDRYPKNTPGKYYIDLQCTDCDLCRETAPNHIGRDDATGYSYVFRQPTTPEEVAACEEGRPWVPDRGSWQRRRQVRLADNAHFRLDDLFGVAATGDGWPHCYSRATDLVWPHPSRDLPMIKSSNQATVELTAAGLVFHI